MQGPNESSKSPQSGHDTTTAGANPHFSQAFYCGVGYGHVYGVVLGRAPRHTVKYACGALRRAPCIHTRLRRLATKSCEKCGLSLLLLNGFDDWKRDPCVIALGEVVAY